MATLKLFQAVQKYFEAMGFYAPSQPNQICPINRTNGFYIVAQVGMLISVSGFLIFKAKSAFESFNSIYVILTVLNMTIQFTVILHKMRSILNLIEEYQEFIEKRKH